MLGYYLLINGIVKLNNNEKDVLISLLKEISPLGKMEIKDDLLIIIDYDNLEISWEEFIIGTNSELFTSLKLYESLKYSSENDLTKSLEKNLSKNLFINDYNNDKTIFYHYLESVINEDFKREVFKELYYDKEFLKSIKVYISENGNTSKAAKLSNMHRNTLLNRLDKFNKVTGLDLRNIDDITFVYILLRNL